MVVWNIEEVGKLLLGFIWPYAYMYVWMSFQDCIFAELMKKIDDQERMIREQSGTIREQGEMMKKFEETLKQCMKEKSAQGGSG